VVEAAESEKQRCHPCAGYTKDAFLEKVLEFIWKTDGNMCTQT
jgi:hypothetical protein